VANVYDLGDVVVVTAGFKNSAGTLADPDVVKFDWKLEQSGATTTYTYPTVIVKDSTGVYHVNLNADTEGTYYYRFYSTGTGKAAAEDSFFVKSNF
jgi:hypothetical protein